MLVVEWCCLCACFFFAAAAIVRRPLGRARRSPYTPPPPPPSPLPPLLPLQTVIKAFARSLACKNLNRQQQVRARVRNRTAAIWRLIFNQALKKRRRRRPARHLRALQICKAARDRLLNTQIYRARARVAAAAVAKNGTRSLDRLNALIVI